MKKYLLITLMAVALSATAQQTPTNKTRSNSDYSQVDNYLIGLKRLGIPTSETDNLDASGLPQNTVKIIYNTTLGRLRIYNPLSTSWSDASVSDLTPYYKKTQVDSLFAVLGENVIHKTGNEIKAGNLGLDGLLQTNFYTPGQDNPGVTVRNFTGDGSAGVSLISGENQLYMYQIGNAGDLYGAHYNDIAKFISYTNSGLGTMRFGVNGEQLILSQNHVKVTMPATENDDVISLGQMNSIADGNFIRKSGNNAVGDFQLDKDLKTYLQLGTNETVLSAGRYPYTKAQSFINLSPFDADYNNTNTVLGSAIEKPGGGYTYKSINWQAGNNSMSIQNDTGYGIRYNGDGDWTNANDEQSLMPRKWITSNFINKTEDETKSGNLELSYGGLSGVTLKPDGIIDFRSHGTYHSSIQAGSFGSTKYQADNHYFGNNDNPFLFNIAASGIYRLADGKKALFEGEAIPFAGNTDANFPGAEIADPFQVVVKFSDGRIGQAQKYSLFTHSNGLIDTGNGRIQIGGYLQPGGIQLGNLADPGQPWLRMNEGVTSIGHGDYDSGPAGLLQASSTETRADLNLFVAGFLGQRGIAMNTTETDKGIRINDAVAGVGLEYNSDDDWVNATPQTAMPKKYIDSRLSGYLPLTGGTVVGNVNIYDGELVVNSMRTTGGDAYFKAHDVVDFSGGNINGTVNFSNATSDWNALNIAKKGHINLYSSDGSTQTSIYQEDDNTLRFGNSGGLIVMGNGSISAPVAISTDVVNAAKVTASGDVEVTDLTKGIILKSPNGTRYRVTINDAGDFVKTAL